ncbi:MAG TPA: PfkB family carbohydrate kinase [Dongiaceae bacterium]|nr:PfkB family carbohydrate kinase [Dongiaceae bacterium]
MIVVFGSLNVDLTVPVTHLPEPGETVLGPGYQIVPGGKGANQALAAARAGAKVAMVGRVGRDSFADVALSELRAGGVDISRVERDEHSTGCALIAVDTKGQNQIVLATGANAAALERQVPDEWLTPETLVVMQMEVWPAQNWALVARATARGARVLLNAAPAGPIQGIALASLHWLIVNETEAVAVAAGLGLGRLEARAAASAIASAADITCIVTLGGEGALAFTREASWQIKALPISPVDTTAAGDAFVGAFAAAIDAGAALPDALQTASIAGGLACLNRGAQPSLPLKTAIDARRAELSPAVNIHG